MQSSSASCLTVMSGRYCCFCVPGSHRKRVARKALNDSDERIEPTILFDIISFDVRFVSRVFDMLRFNTCPTDRKRCRFSRRGDYASKKHAQGNASVFHAASRMIACCENSLMRNVPLDSYNTDVVGCGHRYTILSTVASLA